MTELLKNIGKKGKQLLAVTKMKDSVMLSTQIGYSILF
jgi:hypothetical protein